MNALEFLKEHIKDFIFSFLLICLLALGGITLYLVTKKEEPLNASVALVTKEEKDEIEEEVKDDEEKTEEEFYHVDLKGAINNPGVYEVAKDSIINDVINLAGGFKSNAYQDGLNLSKKVSDEMVIYVYPKSEVSKTPVNNNSTPCEVPTYDISDCVEEKRSVIITNESISNSSNNSSNDSSGSSSNSSTNNNQSKIVNLNSASISELTTLNGIGESKAQKIIEYRNSHGNFKTKEEILNVSGIGESVYEKIKDYITV